MADIRVLSSFALKEAYVELVPRFERTSGHAVDTTWEPTVAIMRRLAAGEVFDLVIMSSDGIERLIAEGRLVAGSRVDIATSGIALAVRAGGARPDISSADAFRRALLAARSIGFSTGPSGVYLEILFASMGLAETLRPRTIVSKPGVPVGTMVASGAVEIGFQQLSELMAVRGIDIVGPLPPELQKITTFSAGLHVAAEAVEPGRALLAFLTSVEAAPVIRAKGMEPAQF